MQRTSNINTSAEQIKEKTPCTSEDTFIPGNPLGEENPTKSFSRR